MEYRRKNDDIILRLEKGEEICEKLLELCDEERITAACVTGIGATDDFTVGIYEPARMTYDPVRVTGDHEITNLTGNLNRRGGEPYQHLHITCAGTGGKVTGGHLVRATVSLTAEIFIHCVNIQTEREHDDKLGINLLRI